MVSTRYYLDCRRGNEIGTLKIVICKDRVRALIPTNFRLHPDNWDQKNQRATGDCVGFNPLLKERMGVVEAFIFKSETWNEFAGLKASQIKERVEAHLFGQEKEELPLNNFKARLESYADSRVKPGTCKLYHDTWVLIEKYAKHRKFDASSLALEDITVRWLMGFNSFLAQTSNSQNYRNIHLRNIRAVFNEALDDEITTHYPFRRFKIKAVETEKRSLDVEQLWHYPVEDYQREYLDMFKLMFLLCGINAADLFHLRKLTDGRAVFDRAKTGKHYSIKVEPEAMEIFERYKGKKFLLNVCDRYRDHRDYTHRMNLALQRIGEMERVGRGGRKKIRALFPELTSYWARHTWATLAAEIDVPDPVITCGLGHTPENRTSEIYIRRNRRKVDDANRRLIDWILYGKS